MSFVPSLDHWGNQAQIVKGCDLSWGTLFLGFPPRSQETISSENFFIYLIAFQTSKTKLKGKKMVGKQ